MAMQAYQQTLSVIYYLFGIMFTFFGILIFILFSYNYSQNKVKEYGNKKDVLSGLFSKLKTKESSQRGYILTGNEKYLDEISTIELMVGLDYLKEKATEIEKDLIEDFTNLTLSKLQEMQYVINLYDANEIQKAIDFIMSDKGEKMMKDLSAKLKELLVIYNERIEQYNAKLNGYSYFIYLIMIVFCLIASFLLFRLINNTAPQIKKVEQLNDQLNDSLVKLNLEIKEKEAITAKNEDLIRNLNEKNKELNHFAYIASHDLQEPLRTVSNFVNIIEEDYGPKFDEEATQYFRFITQATDRMRNLINSLLDFSRLGRVTNFENVDGNQIVASAISNLHLKIKEKQAEIITNEYPEMRLLKAEAIQLFQNLISNAVKFSTIERKPVVEIEYQSIEDFHQFTIRDNGIGIEKDQHEKIFDMFSRLHSQKVYEGLGIGLAFCKKIVDLHNGNLWIESVPKLGTALHFTISKNL